MRCVYTQNIRKYVGDSILFYYLLIRIWCVNTQNVRKYEYNLAGTIVLGDVLAYVAWIYVREINGMSNAATS